MFLIKNKNFPVLISVVLTLLLTSCGNVRKATYLYGVDEANFRNVLDNQEPILQKNDILSISVSSINPEAAEIFNISNNSEGRSSTVSGSTAEVSGYLIDNEGNIQFPVLGKISAAGKTKRQLASDIAEQLDTRKLLIDPIVDIRYLNFKISVLGEVKDPSVLTVPEEKISIFEALGLAGDITVFGNKENVALIREIDGKRTVRRIDLTSNEILASPYYYLNSNDILYVEPTRARVASASEVRQWIPVILSAISLAVITIVNFN